MDGWGARPLRWLSVLVEMSASLAFLALTQVSCALCLLQLALDRKGRLFTWGFGGYGRLGHNEPKDELVPRQIRMLEATQIACGSQFSLAVNKFGRWKPISCGLLFQTKDCVPLPPKPSGLPQCLLVSWAFSEEAWQKFSAAQGCRELACSQPAMCLFYSMPVNSGGQQM